MKRIEHYLNEKNNKVYCPLDRTYYCHNGCAWFDHEEQDCRKLLIQSEIKYNLIRIGDLLENGKREFKF